MSHSLQLQTARLQEAQVDLIVVEEITDLFIDAGIHLDAVNIEGLSASQLCTARKCMHKPIIYPNLKAPFLTN